MNVYGVICSNYCIHLPCHLMVLAAAVVRCIFALYTMSTTIAGDKHSDESWHAINPSLMNVEVGCQLGPFCVPDLGCDKSTVLVPHVSII